MRAGHAGCRGRDVVWTYGTRWIVPEVSGGPVPCQTKATCERVGTGLEKCIYTPRGGTVRPRHPSEWFGIDTAYTTPPHTYSAIDDIDARTVTVETAQETQDTDTDTVPSADLLARSYRISQRPNPRHHG